MKITATIRNTPTLRDSYPGRLNVPSTLDLRDSDEARRNKPVQLIAGTSGVVLTAVGGIGAIQFTFRDLSRQPRDVSRHMVSTGNRTILTNTETLCGTYTVTARDSRASQKEWYVRFVKVTIAHTIPGTKQAEFDVDINEGAIETIAVTGGVSAEAVAYVQPLDGTVMPEVHVGFIQNLQGNPSFHGTYAQSIGGRDTDRQRNVVEQGRPPIAPPWIDCGLPEWTDIQKVRTKCTVKNFPFYGQDNACDEDGAVLETHSGPSRIITFWDTPAATFPAFVDDAHKPLSKDDAATEDHWALRRIHGANEFSLAIVARTKDAPFKFMVLALAHWTIHVNLEFLPIPPARGQGFAYNVPLADVSKDTLANVRAGFTRLTPMPIPRDAAAVGLEVYGPGSIDEEDEE